MRLAYETEIFQKSNYTRRNERPQHKNAVQHPHSTNKTNEKKKKTKSRSLQRSRDSYQHELLTTDARRDRIHRELPSEFQAQKQRAGCRNSMVERNSDHEEASPATLRPLNLPQIPLKNSQRKRNTLALPNGKEKSSVETTQRRAHGDGRVEARPQARRGRMQKLRNPSLRAGGLY